jgi:hypothetical protein
LFAKWAYNFFLIFKSRSYEVVSCTVRIQNRSKCIYFLTTKRYSAKQLLNTCKHNRCITYISDHCLFSYWICLNFNFRTPIKYRDYFVKLTTTKIVSEFLFTFRNTVPVLWCKCGGMYLVYDLVSSRSYNLINCLINVLPFSHVLQFIEMFA